MINRIILNETSYFGRNSVSKLSFEISKRGFTKGLVVTDKVLLETKVIEPVLDELKNNNIDFEIFSGIVPNPTIDNVLAGTDFLNKSNADFIIAVGGGSPIDTAKAIGIIKTNPEFIDVTKLAGLAPTKNKSLPIIAIPTTSGTAAEVTINYVITDEVKKVKMVCVDPNDIPILSIIDPNLMDKMPKSVASSTGMDALTHAMEGFITKGAWTMSDMYHEKSMTMIYENLEAAVNKKESIAIENVAYAQYIAGMGFSNVGLGIVHSMAHALGAIYDTPHGLANAMILPHVLKFNGPACINKYKEIAKFFNLFVAGKSDEEVIDAVVQSVKNLGIKLGIPENLRDINILKCDLEMLSDLALNDVCTGGNPRDVTKEDILNIFRSMY